MSSSFYHCASEREKKNFGERTGRIWDLPNSVGESKEDAQKGDQLQSLGDKRKRRVIRLSLPDPILTFVFRHPLHVKVATMNFGHNRSSVNVTKHHRPYDGDKVQWQSDQPESDPLSELE